jgi:hypothetical protein
MRRLSWAALVGFLVCLGLHLATFVAPAVSALYPLGFALLAGAFVVFGPAVAHATTLWRPNDTDWAEPWAIPSWVQAVVVCIGLYVGANFVLIMARTGGLTPEQRGSSYVLTDHDVVVRRSSAAEHHLYRAYEMRLWTGHALVFYAIGAVYVHYLNPANGQTRLTTLHRPR